MNDQGQNPTSTPGTPPPAPGDWREQRRLERQARHDERWSRHAGRPYGWFGGAFLILLGVVLLMENLGLKVLTNWWALFILIPAFWSYVAAWEQYQADGKLSRRAGGSLTVGILLTLLSLIFLFNVTFGLFWPILLIAGGVALLLTGMLPK